MLEPLTSLSSIWGFATSLKGTLEGSWHLKNTSVLSAPWRPLETELPPEI